jgi:hypothetical protein
MRVFVYFNLHKKCFSVKALEGADKGRVIAHRDALMLHSAVFKVSEAGRQRVLRERKKNVHAGVVGQWFDTVPYALDNGTAITYNPYKYNTFVELGTEAPVLTASIAHLANKKITARLDKTV